MNQEPGKEVAMHPKRPLARFRIMYFICLPNLLLPFAIVPLVPSNLHVAETDEDLMYINVYFEWMPPVGQGPAFVVEYYQLSVESNSSYYTTDVATSRSNTSLEYNVNFTVSVISVNCAGQSKHLVLTEVLFSKLTH